MKAIELIGNVDDQHRLQARVPENVPTGRVRLLVLPAEEDATGSPWAEAVANEWADDLQDGRQDLYSLSDGKPIDESQ